MDLAHPQDGVTCTLYLNSALDMVLESSFFSSDFKFTLLPSVKYVDRIPKLKLANHLRWINYHFTSKLLVTMTYILKDGLSLGLD